MEGDGPPTKKGGPQPLFKTFQPLTRKFNDLKEEANKEATDFEFIDANLPKSSNRRAARSHVMRRYHTEKRNQATGNPNKALRHPTQSSQVQVLQWRAPTSSLHGSGTLSKPPSDSHDNSLTASSISNRSSRIVEQDPPCLCRPAKSKQISRQSDCTCMQVQLHPGLEPFFQGPFPVQHRSLQLLQFSKSYPSYLSGSDRPLRLNIPCPNSQQESEATHSLMAILQGIHEVARFNVPLGIQAEVSWFTQATASPAFFHGTLLLGATYRALTLGRVPPFPPECSYHQAEAIRHIIASLESPEAQIHEANVAAVACLGAFETATNHVANESTHIDGLERLIAVRKARKEDGLTGYLQKLIQWVDVSHASANLSPPRFLSIQANIPTRLKPTLDEEMILFNALNGKWPDTFPSGPVTVFEGMDDITAYIFHRVRQISSLASRIYTSNPKSEATEELRQQYSQGMLLLEGQINASIWSLARNNVRQHGSSTQARAADSVRACTRTWHATCLLYTHLILRRAYPSPKSIIISKVTTRVKYSLKILSETELWVSFPKPFLLWVLCIVGIAESGAGQLPAYGGNVSGDKMWLLQVLGKLRRVMGLGSWEEAKAIVTQFAWVEHLCNLPSRRFWDDSDTYSTIMADGSEVVRHEIWSTPVHPPRTLLTILSNNMTHNEE